MFVALFVIAGCSSGGNLPTDTSGEQPSTNTNGGTESEGSSEEESEGVTFDSSLTGEVTYWTFTGEELNTKIIEAFNKDYPNINIKPVSLEFGAMHDNLQTTLAAGNGAPDVALVEQGQFPRYMVGDLLEDLLQPPYDAGRYQEYVSDYSWERWKSVDGKQLLGMPWDVTPGVWFYRADIYEEMGLPSDPEELGIFLREPENVLMAAQTLAANGKFMFEWRDSPAIQYGDAIGYYDSEMNWVRNDEKMAELLDFVKRGNQLGWAPQMSVLFSDEGKQLVSQGKVASFPVGNWAARELKNIFPEQAGKWRATTLPLGLNVGLGGSTFVIPSQSQNKEAAWAFVEWMNLSEDAWKIWVEDSIQPAWKHITELPWYIEHTNEYLGGQLDYALYDSIDDNIPVRRMTPLDGASWPIYIEAVAEAIDNNIDSKTTLQQIEDNVEKQLGADINKIKSELGIQ